MKHKLKIYAYRNMASIVSIITATALLTVLVLQGMMITAIYNQAKRNEEILQGLSCILLIKPEDRNEYNVKACVNSNGVDKKDFLFQTPEDLNIINSIRKKLNAEITIKTTKPVKGDTGAKGADGKNGKDGTNGKTEVIKKEVILDGAPGEPGQPGREVEMRYNDAKQRLEWRYVGDDIWRKLVDACTITSSC